MSKFLKNILNLDTDESKKLSDFMRENSIEFRSNIELNTLFKDYLDVFKMKDTYSIIAEKEITNNYYRFDINSRDFIVAYSKKNKLYEIVQDVKNRLGSDSDLTYYNQIYPNAREADSTKKDAVGCLRANIDKIDKYISECERLKLEVGTCID